MLLNQRYRISIINDYKGTWSYIDFKQFGSMKALEVCEIITTPPKNKGISIFINFEKVASAQSKRDAIIKLEVILKECSAEIKKEIDQYSEILFRSLK